MTIVARRVAAVPARSPTETWHAIRDLLCDRNEAAGVEFDRVTGVLASVISDEVPRNDPITVIGSGPRVRVYCLYGDDAIEDIGEGEQPLAHDPLEADWTVYVPVDEKDLKWVRDALAQASDRFVAYDPAEGLVVETRATGPTRVDVNAAAWRDL